MRVDCEKSVVGSKTARGEKSTPSVWITASMSSKRIPDRVAIKRVSRHLIEARILDWYTGRRTCQCADTMAGAERGPHGFKSDAAASANDKNLGHHF